jgi:hypothetical protein
VRALPLLQPALAAVAVVVLGLAVAGCGSGDASARNAYAAAANRAKGGFEDAVARLQTRVRATSTRAQDRATLDRFDAAAARLATALEAIRPPSAVRGLHARFVAEVRSYRGIVARARRGFASSDPRTVIAARTAFAAAVDRVNARLTGTIAAINRALQGS